MNTVIRSYFILSLFILTGFTKLIAQPGDFYLQHYQIPLPNVGMRNTAVVQGAQGIMYFANQQGVITYDGAFWQKIETKYTPQTLVSVSGVIWVGCRGSLGYLARDQMGKMRYRALLKGFNNNADIIKIKVLRESIYFYSDQAIFEVDSKTKKVTNRWESDFSNPYQGLSIYQDHLVINVKDKGLHRLEKNKQLKLISLATAFKKHYLKAGVMLNKNHIAFTLDNNQSYVFDGRKLFDYESNAQAYMKNNLVHTALEINENIIAFATLSGGVMLLDKKSSNLRNLINYQTGLPDDEVRAMCLDQQQGLWICHAAGISRVDLSLPIRTYSTYAGLENNGSLISVHKAGDTLFVSTSDGVFYLDKVERYAEIKQFIKKEQRYMKKVEVIHAKEIVKDPQNNTPFRVYRSPVSGQKPPRRSITRNEEKEIEARPTRTLTTELSTSLFTTESARKAYALQSIPYVFKKVEGIKAKCKQMLWFRDRLLIVANSGFYETYTRGDSLHARAIVDNAYCNTIHQSSRNPNRFYLGSNKGLVVIEYQPKGNYWKTLDRQEYIDVPVHSILEHEGQIWLGSESEVYRLQMPKDSLTWPVRYRLSNNYADNVIVRLHKGKPIFMISNSVFVYEAKKKRLYERKKLNFLSQNQQIIARQQKHTWVNYQGWRNIDEGAQLSNKARTWLSVFPDVQDLFRDNDGNIWVISDNKLYKVWKDAATQSSPFSFFIRYILDNKDNYQPLKRRKYEYDDNTRAFTFQVASPFYLREQEIQYRYWLEGLDQEKKWSSWENSPRIKLPYVPSGKYKLHIRARNVFGENAEEQVFNFEIEPPFWETYWFYGLQIMILVALLLVSFLFNRRGKNRTVSLVLTIISVITLFEFLFLLAEPYVEDVANGIPVLKLGMNVMLALSLAPIERFLSSWLRKPAQRAPLEAPEDAEGLR